jgi:signal transduction histidine kinase
MWFAHKWRNIGIKLAVLYAALFVLSMVILGAVSLYLTQRALQRQIDQRITAEVSGLLARDAASMQGALAENIARRMQAGVAFRYSLVDADGKAIAGNLPLVASVALKPGWINFSASEAGMDDPADSFRGLGSPTQHGFLIVAEDTDDIENLWNALSTVYIFVALVVGLLASFGGVGLSRLYLRRLDQFAERAQAITAGDHALRMPLTHAGDEFDSLSHSLNRMLDRNAELLARQKQISTDIAHDVRTPLARLRQIVEAEAVMQPEGRLPAALNEIDELLALHNALLRLAEIEEGARSRQFKPIDLTQLASKIVNIYQPSFDEQGKLLEWRDHGAVLIEGDAELLTQLLSNLVENALTHTPKGTRVVVEANHGTRPFITVSDNGPGIPSGLEQEVLKRFYRLDRSRSTPGHGLGLSLAHAIAVLHGAVLTVANASPGLVVTVQWV